MAGHRQYKITDYRFGKMILGLREKTSLTQKEVADVLGVSKRTIQHWEAGTAFPSIQNLKNLIACYLQHSAFSERSELEEAKALWEQADESSSRRKSIFDKRWFDDLLTAYKVPSTESGSKKYEQEIFTSPTKIDWGEAPDMLQVYGREDEFNQLSQWVFNEKCRLISVIGMGGIGKTTLVTKFAYDYASHFDYVIWRSLRNAPTLDTLLMECFQILSPVNASEPSIPLLLELLQKNRCLIIFDNVETIHQAGGQAGIYQEGYEDYQKLIQNVAQIRHQSCLILTSREKLISLQAIEGAHSRMRTLKLEGLTRLASREMLDDSSLFGAGDAWDVFVNYYAGNPLALKIAATTVRDLFSGDLAAFLKEAPVTLHTLNQLLSDQFNHISELERDILFWLAIEREPVDMNILQQNFLFTVSKNEIMSGLLSLLQRSLVERSDQNAAFSLLPVMLEFVTNRLINTIVEQITNHNYQAITKYALVKSQSIDHIRESQVRMILQPILLQLKRHFGGRRALSNYFRQLIPDVRDRSYEAQMYTGGNLLNFLAQLNGNIKGEDFSGLSLRQVYLQGIEAQDSNFSDAAFADSRFTEPLETIGAMTMSPSGTYLAASTYNGHIRCWNIADGKPLWTITNASRAWSLKFSPDETKLACSHFHGQVSLWDVASGQKLNMFEGHQAWVHTIDFHPSGKYLASGGIDTRVCIWDLKEGNLYLELDDPSARIWSLSFSPDGDVLVAGGDEGNIYVWDFKDGKILHTLQQSFSGPVSVAFHPNGKWLASCNEQDPDIHLWDFYLNEIIVSINTHSKGPTSLAFNPDGDLLASGGQDGSVELWQLTDGQSPKYIKMLMGHHHYVSGIVFSQHALLATLSYGEDINIWNVESGKLLRVFEGYSRLIGTNVFSPDGKLLLQGDGSGRIWVRDMSTQQYIRTIVGHTGPIWAIDFSPDGKIFATAGDDRSLRIWDVASFQCLKTYSGHTGQIWSLTFSHDGSILASGASPHEIKLWDPKPATATTELKHIELASDVWSLAFDKNDLRLASGQSDGSVIIWDLQTSEKIITLQHGHTSVGAIRFGSDNQTLITSSNQNILKFWDLRNAECLGTLEIGAEGNRTKAIAIGEDGKLIAHSSIDLNVYGWLGDMAEPIIFKGHTSRVWGLALSPDERYLASSDEEGTTLISDIKSGKVVEKIIIDRPYERMNITGVTGLNAAERIALNALGAATVATQTQEDKL